MNEAEYEKYFSQWEMLSFEIMDNLIQYNSSPFIHLTLHYLRSLVRREMSPRGCGIGRTVSVVPDGSIYICNGLVGDNNFLVGNIFNGLNQKFIDSFRSSYEKYLHKCDNCWARNICGTGCMAQSIRYNELDSQFPPSRLCEFNKKAIETVIYMYCRIKEENPGFSQHLAS